jgi:hypothetical protein
MIGPTKNIKLKLLFLILHFASSQFSKLNMSNCVRKKNHKKFPILFSIQNAILKIKITLGD